MFEKFLKKKVLWKIIKYSTRANDLAIKYYTLTYGQKRQISNEYRVHAVLGNLLPRLQLMLPSAQFFVRMQYLILFSWLKVPELLNFWKLLNTLKISGAGVPESHCVFSHIFPNGVCFFFLESFSLESDCRVFN